MTDQFVAEIRIFPFNFAPTGWALCNGQLLPISQNTGLFSLLGTFYGGDGQSTFALPDLRDRAAMHPGTGAGLTQRTLGEEAGTETVTLLQSEIPAHSHGVGTSQSDGNSQAAAGSRLAGGIGVAHYANAANLAGMAPEAIGPTGGDQPHNNMQPYLTLNFCIALQGIFPQRP